MAEDIRVLLVDDHALVREGIRAVIERQGGIVVVGEAENGREAVARARELGPDVVLMDLAMPVMNGIEATRQIVKSVPPARVIALTMHSDDKFIFQALKAGATGYLLKTSTSADLVTAIRTVYGGSTYFSPSVSRKIMDSYLKEDTSSRKPATDSRLTEREKEVLQLIAEGYSNSKVAELMSISVKTVESHRSHIMKKLDVHDVTGLVKYAIKQGIILY